MLSVFTDQLRTGIELTQVNIDVAAEALSSPDLSEQEKISFLSALADKGETAAEIAGFAKAFRSRCIDPGVDHWSSEAIDIVGTGGDHAGGFNVSSLVVLTLASAGVPVMKHGNRGITSKCGSADLLAALGFDLSASTLKMKEALSQLGYAFFFAPNYHPSFKHIAPARKALAAQGRRSIFNILGPLINPGRPAHILLGVFSPKLLGTLAGALSSLGTTKGLAVHGIIDSSRGIDELTSATDNQVQGIGQLSSLSTLWTPEQFGLTRRPFGDLLGGDLSENTAIAEALLNAKGPQGLEDTIALNASIGLWLLGRTAQPEEGLSYCRDLLVGGAVAQKIADTKEFFRAA